MKTDAIDSPLGTTAIGGAVCTLVVLKRTEAYRTIQTVQRIGPELAETVLTFDPKRRTIGLGYERSQVDALAVAEEILRFLESVADGKTEPEITEEVEGNTGTIRQALRQLVKQGRVTREGAGKRGDPYRYSFLFSCLQPPNLRAEDCR